MGLDAYRWSPSTTVRVAERDADSFAAVREVCLPAVLRYVRNPDEAEDLTADVFERAIGAWPRCEGRSSPVTWLIGIARYALADQHRPSAGPTVSLQEVTDGAPLPTALSGRSGGATRRSTVGATSAVSPSRSGAGPAGVAICCRPVVNPEANIITALICRADGGRHSRVCRRPAIRKIERSAR